MRKPDATALLSGSEDYNQIRGNVSFYATGTSVLVAANVTGLPRGDSVCKSPVFGFHIHEGEACTGNAEDPFADAKSHYNPEECEHPHHAGDLPPLFGNNGSAMMTVFTNRFTVEDITGRTVIVHGSPDDFRTQPSGDAGKKIACGVIMKV